MPTKQEIIADLSPSMRRSYRTLIKNAAELGKVLIWSGNPIDYELEIVDQLYLDCEALMAGKVILFDGRKTVVA